MMAATIKCEKCMDIVAYQSRLLNRIYCNFESKFKKHKEQCNDNHKPDASDNLCIEYRKLMLEREELYDIANRYFFL